jgi:tetratricopeptide (TPR) repeat protein
MMRAVQRLRTRLAPLLAVVLGAVVACEPREEPAPDAPREAETQDAFVAGALCAECHEKEYEAWLGSHHDLAMQEATPDTVLGDFRDTSFTHFGVTSRFFERGGRFFVRTEGTTGVLEDFEIQYTFGALPLQQYLIELPGGRLQCLTIAWDTERGRWFSLYPDEKIGPDDSLHWTGRYQNWNAFCAECHSTNLRKGYDLETDAYTTTWVDIDVSCQACHGPGAEHIRWARERKEGETGSENDALRVQLKGGDSRIEVDTCAPCHSRRHPVSGEDEHGRPFLQDFKPEVLREDLYHADGQILEEVYVYGSFLQSRMYHLGVRCSDCHDSHSIELKAEGDQLCLQCHGPEPPERFPSLVRKSYDAPSHHFHLPDGEGARCVTCHMASRTYMVVDDRRDHSFRAPRPDLSVKIGTPNTCNDCHADKSAEWSVQFVEEWYGSERAATLHWGEVFAAARSGSPDAESALIDLARDRTKPAIVRATALEYLRVHGPNALAAIAAATEDDDPLVRSTAAGALDRLPPEPKRMAAVPLLTDPVRAVRVEAARVLASTSTTGLDPEERRAFDAALAEFKEVQDADSDQPSAHLNLAVIYTGLGQLDLAEQSYQRAMGMDPEFLPARVNLANLYNRMGRNADAEGVLREAIERAPEEGELYYSLGLLLAEEGRIEEAITPLGRAAERIPDRGRVRYNYALALQHVGRRDDAERQLLQAHRVDPRDPGILQALVVFYMQDRRWVDAKASAEKLAELVPGDPGIRDVIQRIEREQSRADTP